jgi:DNA repair protein RecN (Recombination protein N)
MLRELQIKNLAIIEHLELEFEDNLITLTGETGAGKSIILDGINLLIGEKAYREMIRDDEEYLEAQGVFEVNKNQLRSLNDMGIEIDDNEIIVQRRLDKSGKGKAFINGRRVPLTSLKEIMGTLVDLVGQHSHQLLLDSAHHIELIDKFLDEDAIKVKNEIEEIVVEYHQVHNSISKLEEEKEEAKNKKELYEFQLADIDGLALVEGEDEELEEEYKKLFNAGKIQDNLMKSLYLLREDEQSIMSLFNHVKKNIDYISKYGKEFESISERLEKLYFETEDIAYTLDDIVSDVDSDEHRLNKVVDRLDKINSLKKKYGFTIKEILQYRIEIENKLDSIRNSSFEISELKEKLDLLRRKYKESSEKLSVSRKKVANMIEKMLHEELADLNMPNAKFKVDFSIESKIRKNGMDIIEFMIATNVGQQYKPLAKIISGGEVSRIMLALKTVFSKVDNIPILIFDEIDTGVGGETVRKIASKLKEIGKNAQVICITHSPSIAAKGNQQFYIEKKVIDNKTLTTVTKLSNEERIMEIGRMLAGENISDSVIAHAKELLKED